MCRAVFVTLGSTVKLARRAGFPGRPGGLSLHELADRAQLPLETVDAIETDRFDSPADDDRLAAIAGALKRSPTLLEIVSGRLSGAHARDELLTLLEEGDATEDDWQFSTALTSRDAARQLRLAEPPDDDLVRALACDLFVARKRTLSEGDRAWDRLVERHADDGGAGPVLEHTLTVWGAAGVSVLVLTISDSGEATLHKDGELLAGLGLSRLQRARLGLAAEDIEGERLESPDRGLATGGVSHSIEIAGQPITGRVTHEIPEPLRPLVAVLDDIVAALGRSATRPSRG